MTETLITPDELAGMEPRDEREARLMASLRARYAEVLEWRAAVPTAADVATDNKEREHLLAEARAWREVERLMPGHPQALSEALDAAIRLRVENEARGLR